ncbi:MAG: hypothetical protein IPH24_07820 [Crocinitomicaceae bacterium]|nr:hypothetical protein [Crocinitomicaceae bacterium]
MFSQPGPGYIMIIVKNENSDTIKFDSGRNKIFYENKYNFFRQKSSYREVNDQNNTYSANYLDQPVKTIVIRVGYQRMRILIVNPLSYSNVYHFLFQFQPGTFCLDLKKLIEKKWPSQNNFLPVRQEDLVKK